MFKKYLLKEWWVTTNWSLLTPWWILRRLWKNKPSVSLKNNLLKKKSGIQCAHWYYNNPYSSIINPFIFLLESSHYLLHLPRNNNSYVFYPKRHVIAVCDICCGKRDSSLPQKRWVQPISAQDCMAYSQHNPTQFRIALPTPAEAITAHSQHRICYFFFNFAQPTSIIGWQIPF